MVTLRKGVLEADDLQRLHRQVRIRPGNLELYLEILGVSGVRRAIYKAGMAHRIRHDDRLLADLEAAVGAGNVRLLGAGGTTGRSTTAPSPPAQGRFRAEETLPDPDEDDLS